jgi:hypothetical protein
MELSTEIRQQIFGYVLEWKDVKCMQEREDPKDRESRIIPTPKDWERRALKDQPFHFETCPPLFSMNRQILCESISVLMRRPVLMGPPEVSWQHPKFAISKVGIRRLNDTIVFPTSRLLTLYRMACGEKLAIVPRLIVELVSHSENDALWPFFYDQIFRLWKEGLAFDLMFITVRNSIEGLLWAPEKPSKLVAQEKAMTMENYTWLK